MIRILDANIIICYLVEDDTKKTDAIECLLKSNETLLLTDVSVSEIVWVLSSYYENTKEEIVERISALICLPTIKCNKKTILTALRLFQKHNIDWVDAYLASYAEDNTIDEIYSYDRDLDKVKNIKRVEPGK